MTKEQDDLSVLRQSTEDFDFDFDQDNEIVLKEDQEAKVTKLFLGMTAVERMFLSIFLFMNVAIIGLALLLATGRIVF
ncbi:MAG: hypothetical protein H6672_20305 [Anaerolineaceae bacterium]|nr:hypothetical protein [Anaerolineaceae bacterium]